MTRRSTGTYVYGVIAGGRRREVMTRGALEAAVPNRSRGLPGTGPVRLLELERDLFAAVADAPLRVYGEEPLARKLSDLEWVSRAAVAHESVLESFVDAVAVVPMKLFTLFTSDERALGHLRAERRRIDATVKRVANQQEWGVRVVLDRPPAAARTRARPAGGGAASGVSYLREKKAQRDVATELAARAGQTADDLFDRLTSRARLSKRRAANDIAVGGGRLLLDAAFLVPRSQSKSFGSAVAREAKALGRAGYAVTMNGPWPPYSFVQD
ncbi:MAG TPA: GvpL/GvpF family gas vesicle protein [Vicinamibacterales bacterium]|nr:GvpL/GvpF family gas vesicle protein [Vicinamibacterales bacterium]